MKKPTHLFVLLFVSVLLLWIPPIHSQDTGYQQYAGYVDFSTLTIPADADEKVEIFLESPILRFVAKLSAEREPEFAEFLNKIVLIKANIFEMNSSRHEDISQTIKNISNDLKSKNWHRAVYVKDTDDEFEIYILLENDILAGLTVMGIDGQDEAVFINIVGEIDPEQLGRLSKKFNIPELDDIKIH